MNKKGFTLVELLAVVAILGILSFMAVAGYSQYKDKAIKNAIETLISSTLSASENYFLDHISLNNVTVQTLLSEGYLENALDPSQKGHNCTGTVVKTTDTYSMEGKLNQDKYRVTLVCALGTYCRNFPGNTNC